MSYGYCGCNPYVLIIVILIVLQWFRVGEKKNDFDLTTIVGSGIYAVLKKDC